MFFSSKCAIIHSSKILVVFGDFSTEWFGQENGLKQGCVLSPTLFSVLMNDLVNMLDGVGIGIDVGKQLSYVRLLLSIFLK
jgi:hypothetical protein